MPTQNANLVNLHDEAGTYNVYLKNMINITREVNVFVETISINYKIPIEQSNIEAPTDYILLPLLTPITHKVPVVKFHAIVPQLNLPTDLFTTISNIQYTIKILHAELQRLLDVEFLLLYALDKYLKNTNPSIASKTMTDIISYTERKGFSIDTIKNSMTQLNSLYKQLNLNTKK